MSDQISYLILINEGNNQTVNLVTEVNTTGLTVTARYRLVGGSGTGTQFATASGASSGTSIALTLGASSLAPGNYDVEFWADFGGANQTMLRPNPNENYKMQIVSRFSV